MSLFIFSLAVFFVLQITYSWLLLIIQNKVKADNIICLWWIENVRQSEFRLICAGLGQAAVKLHWTLDCDYNGLCKDGLNLHGQEWHWLVLVWSTLTTLVFAYLILSQADFTPAYFALKMGQVRKACFLLVSGGKMTCAALWGRLDLDCVELDSTLICDSDWKLRLWGVF